MRLTADQIKELVTGAARIEDENGAVRPYRFTKEQSELYRQRKESYYVRSISTAGIRLCFETDSKSLYLKLRFETGSSRQYFSVDVFADGKPVDFWDNFSGVELPQEYIKVELPRDRCDNTFALGEGVKTVTVYLPWTFGVAIEAMELDDGAYAKPVKPQKKLLVYGDSITQGYDALRSSNRYAAKLADWLGAEEFNKAIGGEQFFPELAKLRDPIQPDYITVAYGTNDWNRVDAETFEKNCGEFYANLRKSYPGVKIFAITPIWRKVTEEVKKVGVFDDLERLIRKAVAGLEDVVVLSGKDFVPKDINFFADLRLHPNDEGFAHYAENLYAALKKEI